ncbi:MAG: signal recognition particle protein [Thermoguttaceae bacterium]|nr:signal recognition particle protein [Thermoguttaceae bacterium]
MFESLQQGLSSAFRTLRGHTRLTEANIRDGLLMVQESLLEADVSLSVVNDFIAKVSTQAVGETVLKSLRPTEQIVGIVQKELANLMGPVDHSLHLLPSGVSVLMLCGLQGSGKTTTCGKLAQKLIADGRKPMLVAADLQRPAAIEQLATLAIQVGAAVHTDFESKDPVAVCQAAIKRAKAEGCDTVILDTAGRLHIDQELMDQLCRIDNKVRPQQVYLVVDAMTGQDAVNSAKAFNDALELDGVIMTKLDGDARGGAAVSVKAVTGVPIKFTGTGEHLDAIEEFHPDRIVGRILGMGDILTLVEKAQDAFDQEEMLRQQEQLQKGRFTLDDFRKMMNQMRKLGPLQKILGMIPGMAGMQQMMQSADAEREMRRLGGMIDSMTPQERQNPELIDISRRRRIAMGSGVEAHEINKLVKEFDKMAGLMKQMSGLGPMQRMRAMQQMGGTLSANPNALGKMSGVGTGKRLSNKEKAELKKKREREERRQKREQKKK